MSPGRERIRFPGATDPLAAELVSIAFSLANSELPSPASCCRPGLPTVLGWQKLLGHLSNTTHTFFFISYSLSPLVSRKPLFKINTEKMCYTVSYNTIQPSIKYQTPFKQASWTDWQIYKSREIQRGGAAIQRGSPRCAAKVGQQTAACGFLFFARVYHTSAKWGGGRNKAVLKNETVFYMSCFFLKKVSYPIFTGQKTIFHFSTPPLHFFEFIFAIELI